MFLVLAKLGQFFSYFIYFRFLSDIFKNCWVNFRPQKFSLRHWFQNRHLPPHDHKSRWCDAKTTVSQNCKICNYSHIYGKVQLAFSIILSKFVQSPTQNLGIKAQTYFFEFSVLNEHNKIKLLDQFCKNNLLLPTHVSDSTILPFWSDYTVEMHFSVSDLLMAFNL